MIALVIRLSRQRELFLNTGVSLAARILAALGAFIVSLLIGRQLGASESGYYFLAFSVVTFLAGFSRIGLENTLLRFTGAAFAEQAWGTVRSVFTRAMLLTSGASFVVALLLYLSAGWLAERVFAKPELTAVLRAMAPGVVGLALFTMISMGLQGLRRIVASVFTINIFVNLFLAVALVMFGIVSAEYAGWAYSGASLLAACAGYLLFRRNLGRGDGSVSWPELFQSCLPLWVVVLMGQLTQWSGQFIAGVWVEPEAVAQLAVAQRTALLTSFILMAVNLVVAPRFAAMYKQGQMAELEKLALTSVKLMVLFALPIVVVMLVFPGFLMSLFGEGFRGGAHLLQILVVGQFINVATGSVGYLLTMSGHERDLRNTVLFSGPIAVGTAFTLVPFFGATGSAVATALAIATQNLLAVWQVKRRLGFNTLAVWRR
ncbi:flippase [Microbulbifer sp. SAOS-129_SWC]|uniref:flippase n=1 Tax=Microbulbifer sp. SAOS-129_SWC TaxID=3145235 RepID=UPI00321659E0